jgi:hypothetical protein
MNPEERESDQKQDSEGIPLAVWLITAGVAMALLMAILIVILWPRRSPTRPMTRTLPAMNVAPRPDPVIIRRAMPPRPMTGPGFRASQPAYEGTNLGNWFSDLQSPNPATVQRAREALAALGIEVPGNLTPAGQKTNAMPSLTPQTTPPENVEK